MHALFVISLLDKELGEELRKDVETLHRSLMGMV